MAKAQPGTSIVTLKIALRDIRPPVWRRLMVPGKMNLGQFSEVILAAMGWNGYHLHAFDIGGEQYGDQSNTENVANENRLTLNHIVKSGLVRFVYTYDFGDDWDHVVMIEKPGPLSKAYSTPPVSLASATARPRIAAGPAATRRCWGFWPIPAIPNGTSESNGSARNSTRRLSTSPASTRFWPQGSSRARAGGAVPRSAACQDARIAASRTWVCLGIRSKATEAAAWKAALPRAAWKAAGGDGGIRTLDRALQPYNGLANRRLQPLGHISIPSADVICLTGWRLASLVAGCLVAGRGPLRKQGEAPKRCAFATVPGECRIGGRFMAIGCLM